MRFAPLLAVVPLLFTSIACAQPVTREYDVRELLIDIPDAADAPDLDVSKPAPATRPSGMFIGGQPDDSRSRKLAADRLVASVKTILADVPNASAKEKDGQLQVVAPADRQDRVASALKAARLDLNRQVNIETRVISLPPGLIAELDPGVRANLDHATVRTQDAVNLTDAEVNALLRATQASSDTSALTGPRVTVFNGQRAYVLVTTQTSYVAGYAADSTGKYQPYVGVFDAGLLIDCRAHTDGQSVSLDLRLQLSELLGMKEQPWPGAPAGQKLNIQVPDQRLRQVDRLLTARSRQSMLLHLPTTDPTKADTKTSVFVILRAISIEQKE